jgi:Pumilio-family RNA binding repeat
MVPSESNFKGGDSTDISNVQKPTDVESLGEALAGVNIGGTIGSSPASKLLGSSSIATTPFNIAPGAGATLSRESSNISSDGWGAFVPASTEEAVASFDSGPHLRNEGLDLFLSQSPSQTLGDDVFKFSHTNLPALAEEIQQDPANLSVDTLRMRSKSNLQNVSSGYGDNHHVRRRLESPSASVTGTTTSSRSVSPYGSSNDAGYNRLTGIPAYQNRYETMPTNDSSLNSFPRTDMSRRSPYNKDRNNYRSNAMLSSSNAFDVNGYEMRSSSTNGYTIALEQAHHPLTTVAANGSGATNGQVLYMAMPSPDGRGQVLQPVQMMQLPGKPYTYVLPGAVGSLQGGVQQNVNADLMALPPLQNNRNDYGYDDRTNRVNNGYAVDDRDAYAYGDVLSGNDYNSNDFDPSQLNMDPALASLYASTQRPPLEALLGQIRRLSRDQVGCRLVQQALEEDGPMAATMILHEGLPFWGEAMVDPFGNYLFQKMLEKVTPEERVMLIKNVSTRLVNASLNLHGTRSVQKVVELCADDEKDGHGAGLEENASSVLTAALAPAAARLCIDSHGNHVIQRILLRLGTKYSKFVFDAVAASVGDVARHRHGCCVIQRCLDSPPSESRAYLVRCIVDRSLDLMQDAYGNYVVQYVLDVCCDEDVHAVCESVVGRVNLLAIQKFSSNVMEKCLERCSDRVKEAYLLEMSDSQRVRELMMDPFGNYVIQRALSVATHTQAIRLVEAMRPHLLAAPVTGPNGARSGGIRNTAGGRRIIAKICRRFPNFTLNPVGTQEELYSQNKGNHRYLNHHQQGGMMHAPPHANHVSQAVAYAPIGAPMRHYGSDPNLGQMPVQPPQQQDQHLLYGLGGNSGYYDSFLGNNGAYPTM